MSAKFVCDYLGSVRGVNDVSIGISVNCYNCLLMNEWAFHSCNMGAQSVCLPGLLGVWLLKLSGFKKVRVGKCIMSMPQTLGL